MIIETKVIDNIPLTTYELKTNEIKPLIFFFHGFTSNKDLGIMGRGEELAKLGFYVVALDAYLHGERMPEWFKQLKNEEKYQYIVDIEIETAKNAKSLFENYFINQSNIIKDKYYAYGVSMGAATTFYLSTIDQNLEAAVTLVGSPSFVEYYKKRKQLFNWGDEITNKRLNEYKEHDPLLNSDRFKQTKLFVAVGLNDNVVNPIWAKKLFKKIPKQIVFKEYDTGHESTEEMLNDSYSFIKQYVKNVEEENGKI